MIRRWQGVVVAVACALPARAQPLRANEGPGVAMGEGFVGHAGIAVETAYDTNVFYADQEENESFEAAPFLRIVPSLALSSLSPQRGGETPSQMLVLRLNGSVGVRKYLSDNEAVQNVSSIDAMAGVSLTINPYGALAFSIYDNFLRSVSARNFEANEPFTRDYNMVGAKATIQPGGRALQTDLGFEYHIDFLEEALASGFDPSTRWIRPYLAARWKFLPKTAVLVEGDARFYTKDDQSGTFSESTHGRGLGGMQTLWTPRFGTTLKAGAGVADYDENEDTTQFLAVANLNFYVTKGRLTLGYERDLADSIFSNWYVDDHIYAHYQHYIGDRIIVGVKPGYRHRTYGGLPDNLVDAGAGGTCPAPAEGEACYGASDRTDNLVEAEATLDVRVVSWIFAGVAYYLQMDATDFQTVIGTAGGGTQTEETDSFAKHVVMGRVEAAY